MRLFMDLFKIYADEATGILEEPKALVDANVWVGNLLLSDSNYQKASQLIKQVSKKYSLYVSHTVVAETLTVLRIKKHPDISTVYNKFLSQEYAFLDNTPLDLASIQPFFVKFPKLSIVDAFLLYLSWDKNYTLVTLDKNLYKIAQKLGLKAYGVK